MGKTVRKDTAMAKVRCKKTTVDSFYGNFVYEQKVSGEHFLRKLHELIDWSRFTSKLLRYYKGKGEVGQAPYDPTMLLKMLLLSYLYNISERQVEVMANDSLSIACFLGLGADEKAPDHSTLTLFKDRLLENGGGKSYEELFDEIIRIAQEKGIKFGQLQIVDAVHLIADVNIGKDRGRQRGGKGPRDKDATWGAKGDQVVVGKDGKREKKTEYFYGYKAHVSLNAEAEMITSLRPGYGDEYDGRYLPYLVERDIKKGVAIRTVAADRGYDDGENHYFLEQKRIKSAIRLKTSRTEKKDQNKEGWVKLKESKEYQEGLKERYKIERKFGEMKKWHGFNRSRYVGLARHAIQVYLTSMVVNMKRMVKLLAGISFRGEVESYARAR
jgi:IS5 family transposase